MDFGTFNLQILHFWSFILLLNGKEIDYCDPNLCPFQGKHVLCGYNGEFSPNCTGEYHLEDMTPHIPLILNEHNMYRNILASGQLKCFHPATRMAALEWDPQLAKVAEANVKSCIFAHDECRSTPEYTYSGQNIYYAQTTRTNVTVEQFIAEAIFLWYAEYLDADYTLLQHYHKTLPQTGHFTLLVNDRQNKVGCAYLNNFRPGKPPKRRVIMTCNYPSTNIRDLPSYKQGRPAAECRRRNDQFNSLCDDEIDPNDIYWYDEEQEEV